VARRACGVRGVGRAVCATAVVVGFGGWSGAVVGVEGAGGLPGVGPGVVGCGRVLSAVTGKRVVFISLVQLPVY